MDKRSGYIVTPKPDEAISLSRTSTEGHDVLQAQLLGLGQVAGDGVLALVAAGQVQDTLQAAVVDRRAGDHHGGRLLVGARVSRRVPGDVDEQGPSGAHAVKPMSRRTLVCEGGGLCF